MTSLQTFARCTLPLLTMGLSVGLIMANLLGCGDEKTASVAASSFISVWRLSNENESITLPLRSGYNYNFTVDWGDGASSEITSHDDSDITHTYAESGDHTVTISGELEAWYFNNSGSKNKLISVTDLGNMGWLNLEGAFEGCSNLRQVGGGDVSNVTNMDRMFKGAASIKKIDFSGWNFALLAKMDETFSEVTLPTGVYNTLLQRLYETSTHENFTLDMGNSKYDSRSENIRQLLKERGWSISDGGFSFFVSVWRTSQTSEAIALPLPSGYKYNFTVDWGDDSSSEITSHDDSDITHIYAEAGDYTVTISGTLEAWNFDSEATTHRLQLISVKDLGDVGWRSLKGAFRQCKALEYLSGGNVSGVTDMSSMFGYAESIHLDVGGWDTSKVTDMGSMFEETATANPDVSGWDVSNVTNMEDMFYEADVANPDVSGWDVSNVTDMNYMFDGADVANPDVSLWNVSNVTDMGFMFSRTDVANPDVSGWDTSNVINMESMFTLAGVANPDVSAWDTSKVTDMSSMFKQTPMAQPDMTQWNFLSVTRMDNMFEGLTLPTAIYSSLLNQIHTTSQQNDISFHGGNSKYNSSAIDARSALIDRRWSISDDGLDESVDDGG